MTLNYQDQAHWPNGFGQQQSPIELKVADMIKLPAAPLTVVTPYRMTQVKDDETTIKLLGTGELAIGASHYHCVQAHFHVPTEHQTTRPAAMELHLVHQTRLGQLCVVAVMLGAGAANPTIQKVIEAFAPGQQVTADIALTSLVPTTGTVYHYLGSLTTPPLTEGVLWYVIDAPALTVSPAQAAWFVAQFGANNRAMQPRAERPIAQFELKN